MRIGVDLDDVLADFVPGLLRYHNRRYETRYSKKDVSSYDLTELWGGTVDETIVKIEDFYNSAEFNGVLPLEGAEEGARLLRVENELIVVSARPEETSKRTREWISRYFNGVFSGVYLTGQWARSGNGRKKHEVCREIGIDLLIDDYLGHANECSEDGIRVLLFDQPWNQGELSDGTKRVYSWKDIAEELWARRDSNPRPHG